MEVVNIQVVMHGVRIHMLKMVYVNGFKQNSHI
ncbi:hypothetical protein KSF78_0006821 [Schistosoma japonicum]|nr:hypothetical protein KSF78_0006821 [Schistosoma japonicum]